MFAKKKDQRSLSLARQIQIILYADHMSLAKIVGRKKKDFCSLRNIIFKVSLSSLEHVDQQSNLNNTFQNPT